MTEPTRDQIAADYAKALTQIAKLAQERDTLRSENEKLKLKRT
jgi:cell division protein FtsB